MGGVAWTEEEDHLLKKCIEQYGEGKWHRIPLLAGLNRCRKSCRLRWLNYLRPNIKRGSFAAEEVELIIKLHKLLGNRWSLIAGRLPGRTANDIKNYWNCHLSKRLNSSTASNQRPDQVVVKDEMANTTLSGNTNYAQNLISMSNAMTSSLINPKSPDYGAIFNFQLPPPPLPLDLDQTCSTSTTRLMQHKILEQDSKLVQDGTHDDHMLQQEELCNEYPVLMDQQVPFSDDALGMGFGFEQVKLETPCDDHESSSSSKWDLDDLVLDVDLWSEAF